jgi:glycosyltransferase involved in cell wall biosynthesis
MRKPFFSVIIPTYNRAQFLKIAINSVLCQTSEDYELIIIDDGSTDDTVNVMKEYAEYRPQAKDYKSKIKYVHQFHQGVSKARNTGIKEAKGEFICFLDSDDRFRQEKLEVTKKYIDEYFEYKIFHTNEIWYRSGEFLPQKEFHQKPMGFVFKNAVKLCSISISTVAIKRNLFDEIGLFDEKLPACEDYDFWLRVTAKFPVFLIPEYLTIKEGGHPDQQSKKYPAMDKCRIYALEKILKNGHLDKENYKIALEELRNKCSIYINGALKRGKSTEVEHYEELIKHFEENKCLKT